MVHPKLSMGMIGNGAIFIIGKVHRLAAKRGGEIELVAMPLAHLKPAVMKLPNTIELLQTSPRARLMKTIAKALVSLSCLMGFPVAAQMPTPIAIAPPQQPAGAIALPSERQPGPAEQWMSLGGDLSVRNVTHPTLTPFLPPANLRTGAAVIIAPGGAFICLSIDAEGWSVARWFAAHGIAAFVLKYRTLPTPGDTPGFVRAAGAKMQAIMTPATAKAAITVPPPALADAESAMALVRRRAAEWNIDPKRVGFVGFSAGAATALALVETHTPGARPDFVAPIYPPMDGIAVATDAPPLFVAIAADDPLFGGRGYGLIEGWQRAGRPVELHVFQSGSHGFGLGRAGTTTPEWPDLLLGWLTANKIIPANLGKRN